MSAFTPPVGLRQIGPVMVEPSVVGAVEEKPRSVPGTGPGPGPKGVPGQQDCADTTTDTDCNKCKLMEGYVGKPSRRREVTRQNRDSYDYQIYIANLHAAPERFGYTEIGEPDNRIVDPGFSGFFNLITGVAAEYTVLEWIYNGVEFDGFWRSMCTVVEAKGQYGQFFDNRGVQLGWVKNTEIAKDWVLQKDRQKNAIQHTKPQGKLEWHFKDRNAWRAAATEFGADRVLCRHTVYNRIQLS